ncbi:MAG TPA: crosslink repair DNA glycosylase YcaQ family protein [Acidobacteriaceae bacterium]|jgi:ATP-dependent Lhr-like helicase|nr:crosslink repair DNA glycosylase YcaQ family protein [Acidobacteriaceae bacterium]
MPRKSSKSVGKKTSRSLEAEVRGAVLKSPVVAGDGIEDPLNLFHPVTAAWFRTVFEKPTTSQKLGWPAIARGDSTLILAPTGSGKTLTAFLWCIDRLMLHRKASDTGGCKVLYISPLKALAVDVERNLRSPLAGIAQMAQRMDVPVHAPEISIRTGDTPQRERARFRRHPSELLVTTPESLYLLLTSEASAALRSIDTVIVDEIHALVPTKRGAHLALSLERLESLTGRRLQRIGLSATQRPLDEVAQFLGGVDTAVIAATAGAATVPKDTADSAILKELEAEWLADPIRGDGITDASIAAPRFRPVTIVNASEPKRLDLRIEVPVEDMARLGKMEELSSGPAAQAPRRTSIWSAIYPRLLELIRERQSTLIFVNSRRIAERLAGAINELAEEPMARAHHGSLASEQRSEIEELLKAGRIRALVATSSLELGIDMGAVDLVIQIESPPSIASGMQRIGRAGHQVGAASAGVIFPKFRADLVACAAATRAMHEGLVESTRYLRNPLDVLAQQIVAIVAEPPRRQLEEKQLVKSEETSAVPIDCDALYRLVRSSAPFALLSRGAFDGVLDMLAGRYPSDEFAELRPRITWDRVHNSLTPREGAKRLAILNGGTIPDRGLYGVFLSGSQTKPVRVGELDEEMVFESHAGDAFVLGATTWRVDEITHDRVLVSPAPGEPGKMPFWKGDSIGRPLEFGRRIGALVRELGATPRNAAVSRLIREHDLDPRAADNLLRFLEDQKAATTIVPDDRSIVIERCRDELGDWRVCVLTPFGSRVHAPWAMAVSGRLRAAGAIDVETLWADDGFVLRFPETVEPPDAEVLLLEPAEATDLVLRQLGSTALFAAKFRESAARALLLPRRRLQGRTPLWHQRKRAYDLLSVASRYASFPMVLESYRECLRDVFDMPAFLEILHGIATRNLRVHVVDTSTPSPFAASLLFSYVANYIYDGDAPLAERRAQALTIDQEQLRDLMGDADLRELLDAAAIEETEEQLQALQGPRQAKNLDGVHDLLLNIGDLTRAELARRCIGLDGASVVERLIRMRRVLELQMLGEKRLIAIEDAAKYRDAMGIPLPPGVPKPFLEKGVDAPLELLKRYARTHGPFTAQEAATRFGWSVEPTQNRLRALVHAGRLVEGEFRPGGVHREWCDVEVLRVIRRKSLARLRKEVEPVEQRTLARMATHWHGTLQRRRGLDAVLDAIEQLQGAPLPASVLEREILPARVLTYTASDLDTLIASGEVIWCGIEPIGPVDGRVALYLADHLSELHPLWMDRKLSTTGETEMPEKERQLLELLRSKGAAFFGALHEALGGGYPGETLDALWNLVWRGLVTNDTFHALRAYMNRGTGSRPVRRQHSQANFRSRRTMPPSAQGRWSLVQLPEAKLHSATEWSHAIALQLLNRHGIVTRESMQTENISGGFSAVYDVLKALEESGRVRRGYFVAGLGGAQFALPSAVDSLRSLRNDPEPEKQEMVVLAATDSANLYGSVLRWPSAPVVQQTEVPAESTTRIFSRSVGARVVLRNGELVAYLRRNNPNILVLLPQEEPARSHVARDLANFLVGMGQLDLRKDGASRPNGVLITTVNDVPVAAHFLARFLLDAGFQPAPLGFNLRRALMPLESSDAKANMEPPFSAGVQ